MRSPRADASSETAAPARASESAMIERFSYGPSSEQIGELTVPPGAGPFPVIVNLHGGYWRARYDLLHARPFCQALARETGAAVCNLEYRRPGHAGGGWPGTRDDVVAGTHSLARHAPIDPGRVVVIGHSAGGQLALCLAAAEPSIRGAVSLAGLIDLEQAWRLRLSDGADSAVAAFLGGAPDEVPGRYAQADPLRLAVRPPQRILHGLDDTDVPVSLARAYVDAKTRAGEDVMLVELADTDHMDVIRPGSRAWPTIVETVRALL
jgi:acetyl esterase/lipase